ncbi:MAG: diaminopimelate epimerase, partial [Clostridia bacterium]|nr:diaminopimelate epimerase [Clostridia bacterium]
MRFTKMQGIGNDYIYVNCFEETVRDPATLAIHMSRPHFGVGSDGLVLIEPSEVADFGMRIFNSDGSESEMCGNATRCIAKYVYERGLTDKTEISLMTG